MMIIKEAHNSCTSVRTVRRKLETARKRVFVVIKPTNRLTNNKKMLLKVLEELYGEVYHSDDQSQNKKKKDIDQ